MRLSVHLMVRNGAATVARGIRSVCRELPPDEVEVCYVDTGSTDGTPDEISKVCHELGIHYSGVSLSPDTRPDFFFPDVPESYAPHAVPECTGKQLLADWSKARNLGLDLCVGKYVLKLDADDELMDEGTLCRVLDHMDDVPGLDLLCSPYEVMETPDDIEYVTLYTRLWRNVPGVRFREVCHENVDWCRRLDASNWTIAGRGLTFRDWRDCRGDGARVPHRNLKVLLRQYRRHQVEGTRPSPHLLAYLADESAEVLPGLALQVVDQLPVEVCMADAGWIFTIKARAYSALGMSDYAAGEYARAREAGWDRAEILELLSRPRPEDYRYMVRLWAAVQKSTHWQSGDSLFYPKHASFKEIRATRKMLGNFDPSVPAKMCDFPGCPNRARTDGDHCNQHRSKE